MGICSRFCTPPVESSASRVVVPCVKGKCCRPSTSTEFESTPPAQLAGIISADEYQASIARINAALKRPLWTYRVQTVGRILLLAGFILLLVAGGKFLHMKHKHHGEKQDRPDRPQQRNDAVGHAVAPVVDYPADFYDEQGRPLSPPSGIAEPHVHVASPPSDSSLPPTPPSFPHPQNPNSPAAPLPAKEEWDGHVVEPIDDPNLSTWTYHPSSNTAPAPVPAPAPAPAPAPVQEKDEDDDDDNDEDDAEEEERRMAWRERHGHGRRHHERKGEQQADAAAEAAEEGKQHGRKHHKKCAKHLFHAGLWSVLVGFVLCRWMVGRKQRDLINRVVPAVCAEHHLYTSGGRAVPVSWSLDERSVCRYNCKNNALKLVLDLHTTVPLSRMEVKAKAQQQFDADKHMSASSAYIPLNTNDQA